MTDLSKLVVYFVTRDLIALYLFLIINGLSMCHGISAFLIKVYQMIKPLFVSESRGASGANLVD